ncbi:hypothetical protein ACIBQX_50525, partial [Nonomuraea sp. NPDC049714]
MAGGALALFTLDAGTPAALASALTLPIGAGLGLVLQSTTLITMNSADPRDMGAASGTLTLLRTIGGSLGIALLGTLYAAQVRDDLIAHLGPAAADRLTVMMEVSASRQGLTHRLTDLEVLNGICRP